MKTIAAILTAGLLAGCAENPLAQTHPGSPPQNYRQLAADALPDALKKVSLTGAEISELEARVPGGELADFMACVKTFNSGKSDYYAVFYKDGRFFDVRTALVVDKCEDRAYSALPSKSRAPKTH